MSVTIRIAREADAEAVVKIYGPVVRDTAISFEVEPPTPDEIRGRIRTVLEHAPWLVCEIDGTVAGYAYAGKFHARAAYQWTVEVTVYVHADHHRRGVARGLYTSLLAGLRVQGFRTAVGIIALPNPASVGLHERMGFLRGGFLHAVGYKHGRWHDVGWWELALGERTPVPPPPRPLAEVMNMPAWREALASGAAVVSTARPS
jgi:phosphinothricin acetyltransferase